MESSVDSLKQMESHCTQKHVAVRGLEMMTSCYLSCYLLPGSDFARLANVCTALASSSPTMEDFFHWLEKNESGRGCCREPWLSLYREYHAAKLQRCFLHTIQVQSSTTFIAGSFASSRYLEKEGLTSFAPNDIDVWVWDTLDAQNVQHLYETMVLDPLWLDVKHYEFKRYDPDIDEEDVEDNAAFPSEGEESRRTNGTKMLTVNRRNQLVKRWLMNCVQGQILVNPVAVKFVHK